MASSEESASAGASECGNTKHKLESPCCNATIYISRGDGVMIGTCSKCLDDVCRVNPRTGQHEWLDGKSPWYPGDDLRPMEES